MKKAKRKICLIIYILMLLMLVSCGFKEVEDDKKGYNDSKIEQEGLSFVETSKISTLAADDIVKYTSEHTDCELYDWSEEVTFPISIPEGDVKVEVKNGSVVLSNVTKESWNNYVAMLEENYIFEIDIIELETYCKQFISIFDMDNNFTAVMGWDESNESMYIYMYMCCQEKLSELTNEQVADMVATSLDKERKDIKAVLNVSSNTNIIDGFDVYYIWNANYNDEGVSSYIGVVNDGEIIFLKEDKVTMGLTDEVEFVQKDGEWYMYILSQDFDTGIQSIESYLLEENNFVLSTSISVKDIENIRDLENPIVTFEKRKDVIEVYSINRESEESMLYIKDKNLGELKVK